MISDAFCVKGYNEPLFLAAFSNKFAGYNVNDCSPRNNSDIYLLTLKERVIAKVGSVNYETGEVEFTIASCQDDPINIYVIPESPDITTGSDTYPNAELFATNPIDIKDYTNNDLNPETELPRPTATSSTSAFPVTGDPFGISPVTDILGSATRNADGSITVIEDDGTSITTNPDGSQVIIPPTTAITDCQKLYDKIITQGYADTQTLQQLATLGCPPLDPNIEDFTPINPDTCS